MFRSKSLLILSLALLLCSAPMARAADASAIAEKVKAVVKEKDACWKLYYEQERKIDDRVEVMVNWVCGKEGVVVYLYQEPSVEAAAKVLYEIRTSPVASSATTPGAPPLDSYRFGDESYVSSYYLYSKSSYLLFRTGNIVVRIDSGSNAKTTSAHTLRNAVLFAQLFVEQMRETPNSARIEKEKPLTAAFRLARKKLESRL